MEGEGEKALVNSASEIEDKGKKRPCEDSASVSAASGRKDLERACDARVKAYRDMRAQVKGVSSFRRHYERHDIILVGGKMVTRPSRFFKLPKVPGMRTEVKVGVFNPDGTPFYPAPGSEI
ncbi:hypothetical protein R6Q59_006966 [Mikania micrantha]